MITGIVENKYRKVLVAAQRAKQLARGAHPRVQVTHKKSTVIALQEVEDGLIGFDYVKDQNEVEARLRKGV